jgi:hypothetical protein
MMRQPVSNSPQNDRATYITNTATGFEPQTGAVVSSAPCVLMSSIVKISSTLVGTVFVQFYDIGGTGVVAQAAVPAYTQCSEPLIVPGGTFVWEPGSADECGYIDPVTRKACPGRTPIYGYPFDHGLIIIASIVSDGFQIAAANLIRVTARVRYPADYGTGF